ncbi:putative 1-acyl-sn-glycerol-3-phosphate acyltransferase 1 [Babesia sp. Xinjiang]|uniref:putative 1-acyl-sn-glycerol-3-phosphate acyltransferase 1 n=1 Tax=Babesia sp. Xinjiang TaxID=462227 RepID=UPI000A252069|nr:putative 1-acyl-sn-glycerol-3-phosphate acyltransferase 1 [Babesia sp. Xinjiang]XP_028871455.1 putative 1-acyl-sn-glycerol-3-phosphate acyltransferase 1 [Babesia sp. Xinjiang]ORM40918.1 putative 1-acyl-sn-glycerol-3-phosphate acyltransferase 1 [Babesia sp. Xinjiang]ORM40999.1 putative 1-acyl-sn-glycerol-3-phosphate acyltransferase 1 [Babesia sp. Xinjiang]
MGLVSGVAKVLRTAQFYLLTVSFYFATTFLIILYVILTLPLYLWDKRIVCKVTNRMLSYCFYLSAIVLNCAWKCTILNDLPEDYKKKPRILMFNHLSSADPFLVTSIGIRTPIICTYKDAIHHIPTVKIALTWSGHLPIKFTYDKVNDKKIAFRDSVKQVMRDCKLGIENGFNLAVYPEGKRSRDGVLQEFKDGFFRFAVEHGVEILPCAISNSASLWPLASSFFIGHGHAFINIGKPIDPKGKTVEELKNVTRRAIYDALKQCPTFNPELETVQELEHT